MLTEGIGRSQGALPVHAGAPTDRRQGGGAAWTSAPSELVSASLRPTRRERDVLGLLAQDLSSKQIAEELCITVATARNHIAHLRMKYGARSRLQLVLTAVQLGLINLPREALPV